MPRDQSPLLPASVLVCFTSTWVDDWPFDTTTPQPWYEVTKNLADVIGSVVNANPLTAGVTARKKIFRNICPALFDNTHKTVPINDAALQSLAERIATDFYSWRLVANYDRAIAGIVPHAQDGVADVEWTYEAGDCRTRAVGWPRRDEPEDLQHLDKFDPNLPGGFYLAKTGSGGIGAASGGNMTSGTVAIYEAKVSASGARTAKLDPAGNAITVPAWNAASIAIAASTFGGVTKDGEGKWIWTFNPC